MTQKIVITANMNTQPTQVAPVTYQWHWRRIVAVITIAMCILAIMTYSFLGAVSAGQSEQQQSGDEVTESTETSLLASQVQADSQPTDSVSLQGKEHSPDVDVLAKSQRAIATVYDDQQPSASENSLLDNAKKDDVERGISRQEELAAVEKTPPQLFADNAQLASVALGAKIDTDKVSRAVLTIEVVDREPVNVLKTDIKTTDFDESLTFFSELKNLQGQTVRHVWYYQDQQMASVELSITAPRYRTYSSKNIMPTQTGEWRVEVLDQQGVMLAHKEFRILAEQ
ncbi:DUF2914 domain-containing protein [Pseudoalteromonas mariniglutinosa]|uniref:DUF2914 domain-containing protein n=1 Tax=Pseudoalteromonas mariniglutinosa TaxID=206042 RepID=UPI00385114B5